MTSSSTFFPHKDHSYRNSMLSTAPSSHSSKLFSQPRVFSTNSPIISQNSTCQSQNYHHRHTHSPFLDWKCLLLRLVFLSTVFLFITSSSGSIYLRCHPARDRISFFAFIWRLFSPFVRLARGRAFLVFGFVRWGVSDLVMGGKGVWMGIRDRGSFVGNFVRRYRWLLLNGGLWVWYFFH